MEREEESTEWLRGNMLLNVLNERERERERERESFGDEIDKRTFEVHCVIIRQAEARKIRVRMS
jgi:hypothetical protein